MAGWECATLRDIDCFNRFHCFYFLVYSSAVAAALSICPSIYPSIRPSRLAYIFRLPLHALALCGRVSSWLAGWLAGRLRTLSKRMPRWFSARAFSSFPSSSMRHTRRYAILRGPCRVPCSNIRAFLCYSRKIVVSPHAEFRRRSTGAGQPFLSCRGAAAVVSIVPRARPPACLSWHLQRLPTPVGPPTELRGSKLVTARCSSFPSPVIRKPREARGRGGFRARRV
ncbi:uncharacterized protein J3D65DRAFT_304513 [Phyllosticta citribraziliensis]|uniref:Transmembrane protein n=1 Tax=Phyllosticta citribraziliensis TaxID=989973 RepID=A0ABR1LXS9_9PEZI